MPDKWKAAKGAAARNFVIPGSDRDWNETDPAHVEVLDDTENK